MVMTPTRQQVNVNPRQAHGSCENTSPPSRAPSSLKKPKQSNTKATSTQQDNTFINIRRVSFLSSLRSLLLVSRRRSSLLAGLFLLCGRLASGSLSRGRGLLLCFWRHDVMCGMDGLLACLDVVLKAD